MFTQKRNDRARNWKVFPVQNKMVNILEFSGHVIATTNSTVVAQIHLQTIRKWMGVAIFQWNFIYKNR